MGCPLQSIFVAEVQLLHQCGGLLNCIFGQIHLQYVYKAHDRAVLSITKPTSENQEAQLRQEGNLETNLNEESGEAPDRVFHIDDVQRCLSGRFISAPEACWRLYSFDMQQKSHCVVQMTVHLPEQNSITFNPTTATHGSTQEQRHTMLTRYFERCATSTQAADLLYHNIPKYFTWNKKEKRWQTRSAEAKK